MNECIGLKGQVRIILPKITACFECNLDLFPPTQTYPLCTIANTPRLPEHCIQWAISLYWPSIAATSGSKFDADDPNHIECIFTAALERASLHGIQGVTHKLTVGVAKNIIPAIASTNAIIAAESTAQAIKWLTHSYVPLNDFMLYNGSDSVYTFTFENERKADCLVCGNETLELKQVPGSLLLREFIDVYLKDKMSLSNPSLRRGEESIYLRSPPSLEVITRVNLDKRLEELFPNCDVSLSVSDPTIPVGITLKVNILGSQ